MAGEVYLVEGTPVVWTDTGTGGDEVLDLGTANGNAGAVCVGAYHDFGVTPRPFEYRMAIFISGFTGAPVVGAQVNVYISEGATTTTFSGPESPSDTASGAGSVNRLPNLLGPFPVTVWSTTAGDDLVAYYTFRSDCRYLSPVVHNAAAVALQTSGDTHSVTITPVFQQVQ